jgi:hypothetical protein
MKNIAFALDPDGYCECSFSALMLFILESSYGAVEADASRVFAFTGVEILPKGFRI